MFEGHLRAGIPASVYFGFMRLASALLPLIVAVSGHALNTRDVTSVRTGHARAELVTTVTSVAPGDTFRVALRLLPDAGWHVYWSNPGDAGMPPSLDWKLTGGWKASPLRFPVPERFETPPLASYGYKNEVWYPLDITADGGAPAGHPVTLRARAEWLICREECLPEGADFVVNLGVGRTIPDPENAARVAREADARLPRPAAFGDGVAEFQDSTVVLSWKLNEEDGAQGEARTALADAYFFPALQGVLSHAAPQQVTFVDDRVRLEVRRDDVLRARPDTLRGVLATGAGGARRGYELSLPTRTTMPEDGAEGVDSWTAILVGLLAIAGLALVIVFKRPHLPPGTGDHA